MTRVLLLIIFFVFQTVFSQKELTEITEKYNPYVSELNSGIGVLIQKKGKTESTHIGKGNFNKHTVFNIGSATKKMTAILVLQEEEKGNLKLSDSIGKFLNPIKNVDMSLTIETLLRHRSGLGELVDKRIAEHFMLKSDSIYNQNFLSIIPKNNPEEIGKYNYCNTNYILLGHLLEKVTDKNYFDLLREQIFIPAKMTESYPYVSKKLKNLALPTFRGEDISEFLDYRFFANYAFSAGSVASTLNDMAKFYKHLFENNTLLTKTSLKKLINFDDANYGLGINKLRDNYYGHGGNNIGYAFREYYNPKTKDLILVFSNTFLIPFKKLIVSEILSYVEDKPVISSFNENIANDFKNVVGTYQLESKGLKLKLEILIKDKYMYLFVPAQKSEVILISKEKNKLYNGGFGIELEVNPKNINELIFRQNGLETTIKRIK